MAAGCDAASSQAEVASALDLRGEILRSLEQGGLDAVALSELLDVDGRRIGSILNSLRKQGLIEPTYPTGHFGRMTVSTYSLYPTWIIKSE